MPTVLLARYCSDIGHSAPRGVSSVDRCLPHNTLQLDYLAHADTGQ